MLFQLLFFVACSISSYASPVITNPQTLQWDYLGSQGISSGKADHISIASSQGEVFVAYRDGSSSNRATVRKYQEYGAWDYLGQPGFTPGSAQYLSLKIDNLGRPTLAFQDGAKLSRTSVMRFSDSVWSFVGNQGFSNGAAAFQSLSIDQLNRPVVGYSDLSKYRRSSAMRFDEANGWSVLGYSGFSGSPASFQSIVVNNMNRPVLAFVDGSNSSGPTVMEFTASSNWKKVAPESMPKGPVDYLAFAIASDNTLYLAYRDMGMQNKLSLARYNGGSWEIVGKPGISSGAVKFVSLALDASGAPYVAFQDASKAGRATVLKYQDMEWQSVGSPGFTSGSATHLSLSLAGDHAYLAFSDAGLGNKLAVTKLTGYYDFHVIENQFTAAEVQAQTEGAAIYSILGGADASRFMIDHNTGLLSFLTAPNFELPQDANLDNMYEVVVQVLDQQMQETTGVFRIWIADQAETPNIEPIANVSLNPGTSTTQVEIVVTQPFSDDEISVSASSSNTNIVQVTEVSNSSLTLSHECGMDIGSAVVTVLASSAGLTHTVRFEVEVLPCTSFCAQGKDGTWSYLSQPGISAATLYHHDIAFDDADTPYVAYADNSLGSKLSVKKFIGTTWHPVGLPAFTEGGAWYISMRFGADNIPYVAFQDHAHGLRASVMKYNGVNWEYVGAPGFSEPTKLPYIDAAIGVTNQLHLRFDSLGTPYVAYQDGPNYGLTVKKFDGENWVNVGPTFGSKPDSGGWSMDFAIDRDDAPIVVFSKVFSKEISVLRFNGVDWAPLGSLLGETGDRPSLVIDSQNVVYLSYRTVGFPKLGKILRYSSGLWNPVGDVLSLTPTVSVKLALDSYDNVYAALHKDMSGLREISVHRWQGQTWQDLGVAGKMNPLYVNSMSLSVSKTNNPHVIFADEAHTNRASVKHLTCEGNLTEEE